MVDVQGSFVWSQSLLHKNLLICYDLISCFIIKDLVIVRIVHTWFIIIVNWKESCISNVLNMLFSNVHIININTVITFTFYWCCIVNSFDILSFDILTFQQHFLCFSLVWFGWTNSLKIYKMLFGCWVAGCRVECQDTHDFIP